MRAGTLLFIACFIYGVMHPVCAEATSYQWSQSYGDATDQIPTSIALDPTGGVVLIGHFDGNVNFGGGNIACAGVSDCTFITRIDRFGNHVWTRAVGDSIALGTNRLGVDPSSNVLTANDFRGTVDFGGGPMTAQGFRDGVIAKYDAAGAHVWSRTFGSSNALVSVRATAVDGGGNLIVTGTFTGTVDFGGASLSYTPFFVNMFVVKFDPFGAHVWSKKYTGNSVEITGAAADPTGNVVITGYHGSTFNFGGAPLVGNAQNVFLVKYSSGGNHLWSQSFGGGGTLQHGYDVATDGSGNVIIVGHLRNSLNLGGNLLVSAGSWDIFLAKYDANGNHQWSQSFGDSNTERGYSVAADASGNIILAGHFFGNIHFGGPILFGDPIDFCVARFDGAGNHLWSQVLNVDFLGLQNDKSYSISAAVNAIGEIAFTGSFKDTIDCGGGALVGGGQWDAFIATYATVPTGIVPPDVKGMSLSAYPNPFNPQTTIMYSTTEAGDVNMSVYDVSGRLVRTLVNARTIIGDHQVVWDGRDNRGTAVATGVYVVRVVTPVGVEAKRVVLLR